MYRKPRCGAERQVDDRHRCGGRLRRLVLRPRPALVAPGVGTCGIAAVPAADDHFHRRQERRERAHRGRLAGASVAEHEHAADGRVDRRDQQRELHFLLADDRRKRKWLSHDDIAPPAAAPRDVDG
jgi:hypothetical protein